EPGEGEGGELGEGEEPMVDDITSTAEKRREVWCMAHQTDDRNLLSTQDGYSTSEVLIVTSNGSPPDYVHTNVLLGLDLHSTPQYKPGQPGPDLGSVYEVVVVQGKGLKEEMDAGAMAWATAPGEGMARANAVVTAFRFIMKQSYICALIAMMKEVPFRELGSKVLCLLSFWLLLRQALTERKESQREEEVLSDIRVIHTHKKEDKEVMGESGGHREMMQVLGNTLLAMLNKYWIYICGGMFFFVSFEGRIVMYKIIYMMLLLFCVACYQVHYEWWRSMLKYFWMSVVFYTMLVLILVYTFQFDSSIHVWFNMTGMSKDKLEDLGLEKFSVPALFTRIFIPTSFLLVCILHLHYFHQRFLLLTDIKTVADKQKSTITRLVHLDGSLADISLIKPTLTVTTKDEEAGEKVQLEEEDGKEEEEEKKRSYEEEEEEKRYEEPLEHCSKAEFLFDEMS
ncbi:piezo-type mechanosensitive ion channel component 2-like, partial [Oncorhynchus masou masou]|uniref:piezo-type mechanosensitive ion channel component 2-like n=1 Tax=Oncorhynchus masou masou TaxID=90313 RepID=UPI00318465C9